jgi:hypothetical protein
MKAMADDSGFAVVTEDLIGGEGDNGAPRTVFERSPMKVLQSLSEKPLQQAMKAIEYIDSGRERERKFLKACSPAALNLIATNGPEYLSAVQGLTN